MTNGLGFQDSMRFIFYAHWLVCILYLALTILHKNGVLTIPEIGRTSVIVGFGSLMIFGCTLLSYVWLKYYDENKMDRVDCRYFLPCVISFISRSIFEVSIFIYGSSLDDKWILVSIYMVIALSPNAIRFLDRIK